VFAELAELGLAPLPDLALMRVTQVSMAEVRRKLPTLTGRGLYSLAPSVVLLQGAFPRPVSGRGGVGQGPPRMRS
jgi:hypothetical protein